MAQWQRLIKRPRVRFLTSDIEFLSNEELFLGMPGLSISVSVLYFLRRRPVNSLLITCREDLQLWPCFYVRSIEFSQSPDTSLEFWNSETIVLLPHRGLVFRTFISWNNPLTSAGFELANLECRYEHVTARPPGPTLMYRFYSSYWVFLCPKFIF